MTATTTRPQEPAGTSRRPRRTLLIAAAAGVLVLLVVGTWVVAFSSLLGVRSVDVRGERTIGEAQIRAAADVASGTPLVRVDTDAIAHRVETIDGVYSASVSTSFPSTVVITVVERTPVGVVQAADGYVLIDRTGAQYRAVASVPDGLPVFDLPAGAAARATGEAVATVAAALPADIRPKVETIAALDPDSISLELTDGRVVRWGSAADSSAKARILPPLLRQKGEEFDLTDPSRPFTH